ncbi:cytochrome c family protein [Comamonas sp. NyZ500]|uniref:c-type cytochrome n=1 Tax=Comamonas sp. NyZ500 TaxID=2795732 RepID=UPI00192B7016|nr:cytochrome c family protein [Comamonas sp. NyZ500]MBL5975674.1 cytochrome c family protein [Comamonas sp. NyZ500]
MNTERWLLLGMLSFAATVHAAPDKLPGEQIYARCAACHALAYDRVGPHHCGLLGRRAGTVPGFAYSDAMKNSGFIWDEKTLDRFLTQPMKVLPGTTMTYAGIPDSKERSDLIAYLKQANGSRECHSLRALPH